MIPIPFENLYCLNLDRRKDRLQQFVKLMARMGWDFQRWPAVDAKHLKHPNGQIMEENARRNAELACKMGHLRMIRDAKQNGYKSVLIMEDDAQLIPGRQLILDNAIHDLPEDWEMFYLGVNHINKNQEALTSSLSRVRTGFTTHAYAVHSRAYDRIIETLDLRNQVDVLYADYMHPRGHSYCTRENIFTQRAGISDIINKKVNYAKTIS